MSHFCKAGVVRCMDFRQNKEFNSWIKKSGLLEDDFETYDLISNAGSSQRFMRQLDKEDKDALLEVGVFAELHKGNKIIIIHHSGCGAYNKWYGPLSSDDEKKRQLEDMQKAKNVILRKYPLMEVIKVWAELKKDDGSEIEFTVID